MKTLVVCGDSYMSAVGPTEFGYREHFTEILAAKLGWEYITYARGGCSNQVIRLQVDEAIKRNPTLIIIGTTSPNRYEYPVSRNLNPIRGYGSGFYIKDKGLRNIDYNTKERSFVDDPLFFQSFKNTLISDTLSNIILPNRTKTSPEIFDAWSKFHEHCFDINWKKQLDTWIISSALYKLCSLKIPFLINPEFMILSDLQEFKDRCIPNTKEFNPWRHPHKDTNARFHTDIPTQHKLAANWYERVLKENL